MRTIWKFPLELTAEQAIEIPVTYEVLTVQVQNGEIVAWAIVDTADERVKQRIVIVGTGHPLPDNIDLHIGTVQIGPYVWHVFLGQ